MAKTYASDIRAPVRKLRREARRDGSFQEVMARLKTMKQPPLTKFAGAWEPISEREYRRIKARLDAIRHGGPVR